MFKRLFIALLLSIPMMAHAGSKWDVVGSEAITSFHQADIQVAIEFVSGCEDARFALRGNPEIISEIQDIHFRIGRVKFLVRSFNKSNSEVSFILSDDALAAWKGGRQAYIITTKSDFKTDLSGSKDAINSAWMNCERKHDKTYVLQELPEKGSVQWMFSCAASWSVAKKLNLPGADANLPLIDKTIEKAVATGVSSGIPGQQLRNMSTEILDNVHRKAESSDNPSSVLNGYNCGSLMLEFSEGMII